MAGLRHPDRGWICAYWGNKARAVITARLPFRHRGFEATGGTRTRTPCDTVAEVVPANGTQYNLLFPDGATDARPAGTALPIAAPCLAAALRESNPRPCHDLVRRKAGLRHPSGNVFFWPRPNIQGNKRRACQPRPKPQPGSRTHLTASEKAAFYQRSIAHLRHLNCSDSAGLERTTEAAPSRPMTAPIGQPSS